jgi:hypothetical protein
MPRKKTVPVEVVQAPAPPQDEIPAAKAALPTKVTLESDFVFWSSHHGAEITRQFIANQVVRDPEVIASLIANDAPLKD